MRHWRFISYIRCQRLHHRPVVSFTFTSNSFKCIDRTEPGLQLVASQQFDCLDETVGDPPVLISLSLHPVSFGCGVRLLDGCFGDAMGRKVPPDQKRYTNYGDNTNQQIPHAGAVLDPESPVQEIRWWRVHQILFQLPPATTHHTGEDGSAAL